MSAINLVNSLDIPRLLVSLIEVNHSLDHKALRHIEEASREGEIVDPITCLVETEQEQEACDGVGDGVVDEPHELSH